MSSFAEYEKFDAIGLAELVRKREVSPALLLEEAQARCDLWNGKINAVVYRCDETARKQSENVTPDQPFCGVPLLVKDLSSPLAGCPYTMGSRALTDFVPTSDGEVMKRFKRAGFLIFGKTNVPEFGLLPVTEPELFGPCRNPWDLTLTAGGSSGGAAAAVAARIVPLAHASDGGGSIRIPASCCGLFGLKPSRGLCALDSQIHGITDDFAAEHVVTRSVRDSAAVLDAVSNRRGHEFVKALALPRRPLRIGVARSAILGKKVAPEAEAALDHAAALLAELGHRVEDAEPLTDYKALAQAFLIYWAAGAAQTLQGVETLLERALAKREVEDLTLGLASIGKTLRDEDLVSARTAFWRATKAYNDFFHTYDILLTPVVSRLPLKIGEGRLSALERWLIEAVVRIQRAGVLRSSKLSKMLLGLLTNRGFAFASFTAPFNITGQPAASVPLYWTKEGVPMGVQLGARLGADKLVLQLARQLEEANPWAHRMPQLSPDRELSQAA